MSSCTTAGSEHPSISIHISTSSPTLDLSFDTPFTITVKTTLNAAHPITFQRRHTPLFHRLLFTPGLTFKNTRTGEHVSRPTMSVCYLGSNDKGLPTEKYRMRWMTLYPDHPHILEATFEPVYRPGPPYSTPGMTAAETAEIRELQSQQKPLRKWAHVGGLEDGQRYEIGISDGVEVKEWVAGDLEGILDAVKAGTVPVLSKEKIGFDVVQGAAFTMKRPDEDGSLSDII